MRVQTRVEIPEDIQLGRAHAESSGLCSARDAAMTKQNHLCSVHIYCAHTHSHRTRSGIVYMCTPILVYVYGTDSANGVPCARSPRVLPSIFHSMQPPRQHGMHIMSPREEEIVCSVPFVRRPPVVYDSATLLSATSPRARCSRRVDAAASASAKCTSQPEHRVHEASQVVR